jgi:cobalt/nickel transport system ATP-binding protein
LLGPNGAGKTTLILHLDGSLSGGAGTVAVGGVPVRGAHVAKIRRRVGIVLADPGDQLFMPTVADDVAFGPASLGLRGTELRDRVGDALASAGVSEFRDRPPYRLSLGQRRRVALATVLATRPDVLVLDEPSANLDAASRRELAEVVAGLDVTLLVVTSDLPYALELCDRSIILDGGRIVADGPTAGLLGDRAVLAAHRLELPTGFSALH